MAKINEFDHPTREANYRRANEEMPWVRQAERDLMLALARPQPGETVVDLGCGSGIISVPLGRAVGSKGRVHTFDGSRRMVEAMAEKAQRLDLPITATKLDEERLPLPDSSVDMVASLAAFHHFADWEQYVSEAARVLKPGGWLVIGDIDATTRPAAYFNGPINKRCSTGHRLPYLSSRIVEDICDNIYLALDFCAVVDVPWRFHDEAEAAWWLHTLHDANCLPGDSLSVAKQFIGWQTVPDDEFPFRINWQLLFVRAVNRELSRRVGP